MVSEQNHSAYTRMVVIVAVILLVLTAAINILVDPYLRFGTPTIRGLSVLKPAAIGQVRMAKAYGVLRKEFNTVLLGNSRVDVGIDPDSSVFQEEQRPVYNLGQPGTGTDMALTYLQHATHHHAPRLTLIGVDFLSYLQPKNRPASNSSRVYSPDFARLNAHNQTVPWWHRQTQPIMDGLSACLSLSSLQATARTLSAQSNKNSASINEHGFNSGTAFRDLIAAEGQASLFEQKNREYVERNLQRFAPSLEESTEMKAIEDLLTYCQQKNMELRVFTHAYHVDVLHIIDETGHWPAFERWKKALAEKCERFGVPCWDFAQVNNWTTEQPPERQGQEDDHAMVLGIRSLSL